MEGICVEYAYSSTRIRRARAGNGKESWGAREKSGEVGSGRVQDEACVAAAWGCYLAPWNIPIAHLLFCFYSIFHTTYNITLPAVHPAGCSPFDLARPYQLSLVLRFSHLRKHYCVSTSRGWHSTGPCNTTINVPVRNSKSASAPGTIRRI